MGSWWIYNNEEATQSEASNAEGTRAVKEQRGTLRKIPGGREDVFTDKSIDLRSTRSLMKFLKLAADAEAYPTVIPEWGERPFHEYLESRFKISPSLQAPLHALTLSPDPSNQTTVAYALPRVHRHLTSIGLFGPGFGAVLPKWGGLAEISQVACRAGAVGGGVYVLKKGIESVEQPSHGSSSTEGAEPRPSAVILQGGDVIKTRWIIGTPSALPKDATHDTPQKSDAVGITHLTAIVSSPLTALFPPPAEGSPPPAGVVVVMPSASLNLPPSLGSSSVAHVPAIYLIIHSSDTGECPEGQCMYLHLLQRLIRQSTGFLCLSPREHMMIQPIEYLSTLPAISIEDNITSDNLMSHSHPPLLSFHCLQKHPGNNSLRREKASSTPPLLSPNPQPSFSFDPPSIPSFPQSTSNQRQRSCGLYRIRSTTTNPLLHPP